MAEVRAAADAARAAQRKADELACRAWNVRMKEEGGPAQPSPSELSRARPPKREPNIVFGVRVKVMLSCL
jgi:hypothetical protein